jgi:hypothetical protein
MLLAVAFAVLNTLPPTCPHDPVARPVERGLVSSSSRPAIDIRVGAGFAYAGCFAFDVGGVAHGTRYVFVDADGARLRRLFVLQFEEFLPSSKEIYRYDMSSATDMGGLRFRQNTFSYSNAAGAAEPNEGTLTAAFLVQRGYEVPDVWTASRFVTLGGEDRKSELILFYLEPAPAGVTLADLYHGEEPTPAWQALRTPLAERSRRAFEVVKREVPRDAH